MSHQGTPAWRWDSAGGCRTLLRHGLFDWNVPDWYRILLDDFIFHISFWKIPAMPFTPIIDGLHSIEPPASPHISAMSATKDPTVNDSPLVHCFYDRSQYKHAIRQQTSKLRRTAQSWWLQAYKLHRILHSPQPTLHPCCEGYWRNITYILSYLLHIYYIHWHTPENSGAKAHLIARRYIDAHARAGAMT